MTSSRELHTAVHDAGTPAVTLDAVLSDLPAVDTVAIVEGATVLRLHAAHLTDAVHRLLRVPGARFADMFATEGSTLTLRTLIALDADSRYLILETDLVERKLPWLSEVTPAAFVEECELYEQFGLQPPDGHLLNRLVVAPVSAPEHPQLDEHEAPGRDTHLPFTVGGQAFEFPVGPVRAAGVESLYYGLVTSGEEVVDVYLHTWHKYRGIERRLRGEAPREALFLVERGEGLSAVASSVAFASAVEGALGIAVPDEVGRSRAICLELERLYNHAQCAAALAQSTGLFVGQAQAEIALELLLRVNAAVTGHRYLFGTVDIGVARPIDHPALRRLLPNTRGELCRVMDGMLETNSFLDRVEATGTITAEQSTNLGLVGPIARGSGAAVDARLDHPPAGLRVPNPPVAGRGAGDALARLLVRRAEVDQSTHLIELLTTGELDLAVPASEHRGWGLGVAESPRGETLAWVGLDEQGKVSRARLRTASARNWRAFDDAIRAQNVFTDVPIIEASFWLTVAGRVL